MTRTFLLIAAVIGFVGVALGAFGAHGLEATLQANGRADTFETANRYHMIHALALIAVAWLSTLTPGRWSHIAGWAFVVGSVLFSGSLYVLAIFDIGFMGAIAPIGGVSLLIGWAALGIAIWHWRDA